MPEYVSFPKYVVNRVKGMFIDKQPAFKNKRLGLMKFKDCFKVMKNRGKFKGKKHSTLYALGRTVRTRIINGAELNILFLGVPMLIDIGYSYTIEGQFMKGGFKKNPLKLRPKLKKLIDRLKNGVENLPPVPMAPYSDRALALRDRLVEFGVSLDGANEFVSGGHEEEDITEFLSDEDIAIIRDNFDEIFEPGDDNSNGDE